MLTAQWCFIPIAVLVPPMRIGNASGVGRVGTDVQFTESGLALKGQKKMCAIVGSRVVGIEMIAAHNRPHNPIALARGFFPARASGMVLPRASRAARHSLLTSFLSERRAARRPPLRKGDL
jgi:hypothetical protein